MSRRLDDPAIARRARSLMVKRARREALEARLTRTGRALADEFGIPYSLALGYAYTQRNDQETPNP